MKKIAFISTFLFLIICLSSTNAEPLEDLIRDYSRELMLAAKEINAIADKIEYGKKIIVKKPKDRYPYFEIAEILSMNEVKTTGQPGREIWMREERTGESNEILLRPEADEFKLAQENLTRMINSSLPLYSKISKDLRLGENFLNSEVFQKELNTFKDHSILIISIAGFQNIKDIPDTPDELPHYGAWKVIQDRIVKLEIEKSLKAYEQKYGSNADKMNFFEVVLVNRISPFKGDIDGPSCFEPICRISPIIYNFEGGNIFPMVQVGFNYYFLGENNFFLNLIHHIGFAACAADIENNQFYKIEKISFGGAIHIGKYELGVMRDIREEDWKVISTVDFQVVKGIF